MEKEYFSSPLPAVADINGLTFWQSMGIAAMLFSCHENYAGTLLNDCFLKVRSAFENKRAIILFNHDHRPAALATYHTYQDCQQDDRLAGLAIKEDDVVFDYLISPFSSPLPYYRFIKKYITIHGGHEFERAFLLDHSTNKLRHIW